MSIPLSRKDKLLYGAGDIGFSLSLTIVGVYFAIFLTDVVGLAPRIAAAAIFIGRSWDYINDPLIGHISDRTRSRWGRRRPFLLFGALPFAIAFTLMWVHPPWENQLALAVYYAVAYIFFDAAATFAYMPYFALTPELSSDYDERTSLTSYRMFFSILGSLLAFTIPLIIIGEFRPGSANRVLIMGITFGVVSALPLLLTFFGTRERQDFMDMDQPNLRTSLRAALKNSPFLYSIAIFLVTWITMDIIQTTLLYFIKYVVVREPQSDKIMAVIFITAIIALPLWERASRKWGKRWAYVIGVAFWSLVQLILITLNASTGFPWIILLCFLAGIGVAAAHVLPWSIMPDAIEWDEWQTGERHEGMFYSLIILMQKIASSIAIPLVLLLLEFTGYVPNAAEQTPNAILGIRLVVGPIPAVLLGLGIVFAIRYPLSREKFKQIASDLDAKRKASKSPEMI